MGPPHGYEVLDVRDGGGGPGVREPLLTAIELESVVPKEWGVRDLNWMDDQSLCGTFWTTTDHYGPLRTTADNCGQLGKTTDNYGKTSENYGKLRTTTLDRTTGTHQLHLF